MSANPIPTEIKLHRQSGLLDLSFNDGVKASLGAEFLRVHSPSAEVKGHGAGQEVLQVGKEDVLIDNLEAIGQYAIRLIFSDGHNSGLYTWEYLHELATHADTLWQTYLSKLAEAGHQRRSSAETSPASVGLYKPD